MARDYTKYTVEGLGENLNKRQLVFTIVKDWATKNKPSLEEIQAIFPEETQGSKGFILKKSEVKDAKRFNMKEPLSIKNGTKVVVSNQWGTKNIASFLELAKKLGYNVTPIGTESNATEDFTPGSHLTEEQIAEFKEKEAEINGDYSENSWEASSLYDDLIDAEDTAWADAILQKIVDAADSFSTLDTVCESLKERGETERLLAMAKKAEAMAEDANDFISLANVLEPVDKNWAIQLLQKAESSAGYFSDYTTLAEPVLPLDKDWAIRLYQKAETLADDSFDHRDLGELVLPHDKEWAIKLFGKAEEKAEYFTDFINLGDAYGKADGLADKAKAKTLFEKAFPLIDNKWHKNNLLDSAKDVLGNDDAFTKKMVEFIENDIPKMKLPKQYFPDYKLEWGKYITFTLDNGPACHKIDNFSIKLNMETNEVIGRPDCDNALSRWFCSWEVAIYDGYASDRSYDGIVRIWGQDDSQEWSVYCHNAFEELEEGELPEGVSGDDIWNALGNGNAIYEMYYHIKTYGE